MKRSHKAAALLAGYALHSIAWPLDRAGELLQTAVPLGVSQAFAEVLERVQDVLKRNFPQAETFKEELKKLDDEKRRKIEEASGVTLDPERDKRFFFHVAKSGGQVLGYAIEDNVPGKWGPIYYLLTLDPSGSVMDVTVLEYRERRGAPVAKRRFLDQFKGKRIDNPVRLQKDIQGITGASISSRGVTDGVRKLLHVFRMFYAAS